MKFSVIIPVYNVEEYIEKCLFSVMNQTLEDFECLVVNDGTKDNSVEVGKKTVGDDLRFIFLDKENGGLSDARNFGLRHAKGEYVFFLDSDDFIDKKLLEKTYAMAKKHDSDIVCFDLMYLYERRMEISAGSYTEVASFKDDKNIIFINNSSNNKIYRRSFMEGKEFIKGMWYEDLAIVPVWIGEANNVSYVDSPLYYYVQRAGSISHSADKRIFDIYKAVDNIKDKLHLTNEDLSGIYLDNCLVMTTLRIRDIEDDNMRLSFYKENISKLNERFPEWYKCALNKDYSFKQKVVFSLLRFKCFKLLDKIY